MLSREIMNAMGLEDPRATFCMTSRVSRIKANGAIDRTEERMIVAALYQQGSQAVIKFYPGVTGHESIVWNPEDILSRKTHTTQVSMFGGFKLAKWYLCAGTPGRWPSQYVTVKDMHAMANYFVGRVNPEWSITVLPGTREEWERDLKVGRYSYADVKRPTLGVVTVIDPEKGGRIMGYMWLDKDGKDSFPFLYGDFYQALAKHHKHMGRY